MNRLELQQHPHQTHEKICRGIRIEGYAAFQHATIRIAKLIGALEL